MDTGIQQKINYNSISRSIMYTKYLDTNLTSSISYSIVSFVKPVDVTSTSERFIGGKDGIQSGSEAKSSLSQQLLDYICIYMIEVIEDAIVCLRKSQRNEVKSSGYSPRMGP